MGAGFGTMMVQLSAGPRTTPPVASSRAYLRSGLPAVYQESDFGMRFIGAPRGAAGPDRRGARRAARRTSTPTTRRATCSTCSRPGSGVDLDESQEIRHQREMVRRAADLGRKRGTVAGMELALELAFPDVPLRIEDQGGVRWSLDQHPVDAPPPSFVVYCDKPVGDEVQAGIARCIEQHKPVGTSYRLRVKAPKKKDTS